MCSRCGFRALDCLQLMINSFQRNIHRLSNCWAMIYKYMRHILHTHTCCGIHIMDINKMVIIVMISVLSLSYSLCVCVCVYLKLKFSLSATYGAVACFQVVSLCHRRFALSNHNQIT